MDVRLSRRQFEIALVSAMGGAPRALAQQPVNPPKEVPWLAEVQRPPARLPADAPRLPSLLFDSRGDPITTVDAWKARREQIRAAWLELLGTWDPPRRPLEYEIISTDRTPLVVRRLIRYETERNVPVEAYLLAPTRSAERMPGVVVLHSTVDYTIRQGAGLEGDPRAAWGLRLAERGMIALCPRCFLWDGNSAPDFTGQVNRHQQRHPNTRGLGKMLYDGRRALDLLCTMSEVDPTRLGVAGHSLGGKEALYLAAFDDRVKAAVSSEGGIGANFSNWDAPWYLGTKLAGHDHHEVLSLVAPRAFLLIAGESADGARSWPFIQAAMDVYRLYGQPAHLGMFNHAAGHKIPPAAEGRACQWLETYL